MRNFRIYGGIVTFLPVCIVPDNVAFAQFPNDPRSIFSEAIGDQGIGATNARNGTNGDFRVVAENNQIFDGIDEDTFWDFTTWKWSNDSTAFTEPFASIGELQKAILTVGLDTRGGEVNTDWVEIDDGPFNNIEEVQNLPGNQTIEFVLELLDYADDTDRQRSPSAWSQLSLSRTTKSKSCRPITSSGRTTRIRSIRRQLSRLLFPRPPT